MQLSDYCQAHDIDAKRLARELRVSLRTAYRYLNRERIPSMKVMPRVRRLCGNEVTADDFYPNTTRA